MKNRLKPLGFTIIEIVIAIAIIGILAAVAIPSYQNYLKKSKISEALLLASPAKVAIANYYETYGKLPNNNTEAMFTPATGKYVTSVNIESGGVINVTINYGGDSSGNLVITPTP